MIATDTRTMPAWLSDASRPATRISAPTALAPAKTAPKTRNGEGPRYASAARLARRTIVW